MNRNKELYGVLSLVHIMLFNFIADSIKREDQKKWVKLVDELLGDIAVLALGKDADGAEYGAILDNASTKFFQGVRKRKKDMADANNIIKDAYKIINKN